MEHALPDLSRLAMSTGVEGGADEGAKRRRTEGGPVEAEYAFNYLPSRSSTRWFAVADKQDRVGPTFQLMGLPPEQAFHAFRADPMVHRVWTRGLDASASDMDKALNYYPDVSRMLWSQARPVWKQNIDGDKFREMFFYTAEPNIDPRVFDDDVATGLWDDYTMACERFEVGDTVAEVRGWLKKLNETKDSGKEQEQELITNARNMHEGVVTTSMDTDSGDDPTLPRLRESYETVQVGFGPAPLPNRSELIDDDDNLLEGFNKLDATRTRYRAYQTRAAQGQDGGYDVLRYGLTADQNRSINSPEVNRMPFMTVHQMMDLENKRRAEMERAIADIGASFYGAVGLGSSSMKLPRADYVSKPLLLIGVLHEMGGSDCGSCTRAIGVTTMPRDADDNMRQNCQALLDSCDWL